ncbi:MAG: type III-B CRISPR module RAMP protein Cmr6 [Candidatus Micrarchaeota archaeon]|nr:type III-B CRISPR module RAMP protein Cmr6 [Candidatus Micrarchaeota archaeon]
MSSPTNIYSNILYEAREGHYKDCNAIALNLFCAKKDTEGFNEGKRKLLDNMINDVNTNAKEIIQRYCIPLLNISAQALDHSRFKYKLDITAKTNSRLLINMASGLGKTVFEVGLNIHPLFGIPYIPSSSIKGSLRSYIHNNYPSKEVIFGNEERIGELAVLDAFPISYEKRLLDGEVTAPIYGSGDVKKFKEHQVSPIPVIYPCIAKGVTFRFIIALNSEELKKEIMDYFLAMMREGIGAKTLLGYGEMSPDGSMTHASGDDHE